MRSSTLQKALFLDRDGIINVDHGYVSKIEDFEFSKGIFKITKLFQEAGYRLFVITNQSGIGRGYYTEADFQILTEWMIRKFAERGIVIDELFYCPHTPKEFCRCRKPNIGMIEACLSKYPISLKESWMIGDKESDIELAHNAGIENTIFIGENPPDKTTLSFASVEACAYDLQENQGRIVPNI